jgi:hypothetical protein
MQSCHNGSLIFHVRNYSQITEKQEKTKNLKFYNQRLAA